MAPKRNGERMSDQRAPQPGYPVDAVAAPRPDGRARLPAGKPPFLLKIGWRMAEQDDQLRQLAADLKDLRSEFDLVLVHGGGAEVTRISEQLGFRPLFHEGIRVTTAEEMDIVEMILSGRVNKRLVRLFQAAGLPAVGLSGADGRLYSGRSLGRINEVPTRTGKVANVELGLLRQLLEAGYFPVVSSTTMDETGEGININADTVAFELACALESRVLMFLSDIPGVMKGGAVIPLLRSEEVKAEIRSATISGGMIPKATSALEALKRGVGTVIIGQYGGRGSLRALVGGDMGTRFEA
jgi:acetylglutamate kinase